MTTILIKKKDTAGAPAAGDLTNAAGGAEIAVNTATKRIYTKDSGGNVVEIGTNPSSLDVPVIISGTTTDAALRITQLGTGNALLVEDSTNPDSTPFVIDNAGQVVIGNDTAISYASSIVPQLQVNKAGAEQIGISRFSADTGSNAFVFLKSRGATINAFDVVASGDGLGSVNWYGSDGTAGIQAASVSAAVDGTPGTNDMPGRLVFSTTADGASTPTERVRIDSSGNVGIGTTTPAGLLQVQSNLAGNNQLLLTNIASSNSGAGSEIVFTQGASGYAAGKIQCDREGSYSATASSQDSALVFFTATDGVDAEKLRITSAGNVGIGTSSPSANLDISNAGNATLRLTAGNTSSSVIQLGDTDDGNVGEITYSHSTNSMAFDTNDTERMRIDSAGNVGIGTSSPSTKLEVAGNNTGAENNTLRLTDTATNTAANQQIGKIEFFSSDTSTPGAGVKAYIGAFALDATPDAYLAFATDATTGTPIERMRITSAGNLGIGTTSPSELLSVGAGTASVNSVLYLDGGSDSAKGAGIKLAKAGTAFGFIGAASWMEGATSNDLAFSANSAATIGMRLNSAGNLGLGVTPSTWVTTAGRKAIEIGALGNALFGAGTADISMFSNAYIDTSAQTTYANNGLAGRYQIADGLHRWYNAASGTAGGAITFTQAMTLDASGSLTIGSLTATRLEVNLTENDKVELNVVDSTNTARNFVFSTGDTERMRLPAAGGVQAVTTISVGNATPSASGAGITFPATQSASSDANTLDDYEEGTWTPAQGSGLVVVGAYSSSGQYTKIGRSVTVFGLLVGATSIACSGNSQICTGLPFAPNTEFQGALINAARSFSSNVGALNSTAVQCSEAISATTSVAFTITYFV